MSIVNIPKIMIPENKVSFPIQKPNMYSLQQNLDELTTLYNNAVTNRHKIEHSVYNANQICEQLHIMLVNVKNDLVRAKKDLAYNKKLLTHSKKVEMKRLKCVWKMKNKLEKEAEKAHKRYLKWQEKLDWNISKKNLNNSKKNNLTDDNVKKIDLLKSLIEQKGFVWSSDYFIMYQKWDVNVSKENRYKKMCMFIDENQSQFKF